MLQFSLEYVENHNFILDLKLVEPIDRKYGVMVEYVDMALERDFPDMRKVMLALGFKYLGEAGMERPGYLYALNKRGYWQFRLVSFLFTLHQRAIIWLYRYGRVIQEIPVYEPYSWRYFTPIWGGRKLWKSLVHLVHWKRTDTSHSERS